MRIRIDSKFVLTLLLGILFLGGVSSFLFLKGWSWSIFDELYWTSNFAKPLLRGIIEDFTIDGRLRPMTWVWNFAHFQVFGFHPTVLRFVRFLEICFLIVLYIQILEKKLRLGISWSLLSGFILLRSQPVLEQFRWMELSELPAMIFILLSLWFEKSSSVVAYFWMILACLTKEFFWIFLPFLGFFRGRLREGFLAASLSITVMLVLFLNRHGHSMTYGEIASWPTLLATFAKAGFDLLPWIVLGIVLKISGIKTLQKARGYTLALALGVALSYFFVVLLNTWGYTYYFAPFVLLSSIVFSIYLKDIDKTKGFSTLCLLFGTLFFIRLGYFGSSQYIIWAGRAAVIRWISSLPKEIQTSSNCPIDVKGLGYAADLNQLEKIHSDTVFCKDIESCCAPGVSYLAFSRDKECIQNSTLNERSLQTLGLTPIFKSFRWTVFSCPTRR